MRNKIIDRSSNQLRQVVLLLAIAVILPAGCLLWFMTQAVKNERLAIRQKLIDSYTARGQEIFNKAGEISVSDANNFSSTIQYRPQKLTTSSQAFQKAEKLEFIDANYAGAIKEYEKYKVHSNPDIVYEGMLGYVRCLLKSGRLNEAINICRQCAGEKYFNDEQRAKARLLLIKLATRAQDTEIKNNQDLLNELQKQLSALDTDIPTELQIFILGETIKIAQEAGLAQNLQNQINAAQKFIDSATLTIIATDFLNQNNISNELNESFFKIPAAPPMYGIYLITDDKKTLALLTTEKMQQFWQKSVDDFTDKLVFCQIYDDKGEQIAGEAKNYIGRELATGELFSILNLKNYFAGWKVELYLRSGVFKEAADKKRYVYIWVAATVIVLMLASTLLAGKAVLKQARLNKLKNDFIATVTHELKTPLSSMRVLVDTLLEGRCQSRQQETEYLQLISKENLRLSKLIDNFLTFSRMERNKQVFEMAPASPVEIANSAAEAMQAKFEKANVRFSLDVRKPLPMIEADKDALVTVLVNLLDNAYKYSYDKKEIELKVFADNGLVCFSVKDNGIGLTRKQTRKIFDKFYQADTSLARRAEGAGLGLAIVKFIVNAHKGKIEVESKIGKGSIFTIKLTTNEFR